MILIKNISIITQDKKRRIIENGEIVIEKDRIIDIGKNISKKYKRFQKVIEGKGEVALPGLINTHSHLAMTLLRSYADDLTLEDWWMNYVYPVESKFTRKEVFWGSLLAMMEMIKSGTTCFSDFYYHQTEVAKAAEKIGMRGTLGCGVLDVPTFEYQDRKSAFEIIRKIVNAFKKHDLIKVSLAPHMFQTTSLAAYQESKELANQNNLLLQTHASETKKEVDFSIKKYKQRPIEVLNKYGILDKNTLLAHCCWLNEKEVNILAKSEASVSHCPVSNMKLASGTMPFFEMKRKGINISLGTDGPCSNNNLDMFEEMKMAALIHKGYKLNPTLADAQSVLDMATINGAKALRLEKEIGSLEKGKRADLVIVDFNQSHLIPAHNLASLLVYAANGADVDTVIINGQIVMEKRKIKKINEDAVFKQIKKIAIFHQK